MKGCSRHDSAEAKLLCKSILHSRDNVVIVSNDSGHSTHAWYVFLAPNNTHGKSSVGSGTFVAEDRMAHDLNESKIAFPWLGKREAIKYTLWHDRTAQLYFKNKFDVGEVYFKGAMHSFKAVYTIFFSICNFV